MNPIIIVNKQNPNRIASQTVENETSENPSNPMNFSIVWERKRKRKEKNRIKNNERIYNFAIANKYMGKKYATTTRINVHCKYRLKEHCNNAIKSNNKCLTIRITIVRNRKSSETEKDQNRSSQNDRCIYCLCSGSLDFYIWLFCWRC